MAIFKKRSEQQLAQARIGNAEFEDFSEIQQHSPSQSENPDAEQPEQAAAGEKFIKTQADRQPYEQREASADAEAPEKSGPLRQIGRRQRQSPPVGDPTEEPEQAAAVETPEESAAEQPEPTETKPDAIGYDGVYADTYTDAPNTDSSGADEALTDEKRPPFRQRTRVRTSKKGTEIDPVPESNPTIEHRIKQVKHEVSVPGNEPDDGKFAPVSDHTKEVQIDTSALGTDETGDDLPASPTKKFIKPTVKPSPDQDERKAAFSQESRAAGNKRKKLPLFISAEDELLLSRYPEYSEEENADDIKKFLKKEKKLSLIKLIICAAATLISVLLSFIPILMQTGTAAERTLPLFGGNSLAYGIVLFVLFLIGVVPLINDFADGFAVLTKKRANSDTAMLLMWLAVIIQNITLLASPDKIFTKSPLYNAAALALTLLVCLIRTATVTRTTEGFRLLVTGQEIHAVRPIEDAHRSERIGQGILEPDAKIAYRSKAAFMDKYINTSLSDDPSTGICSRLLPITTAAAVLIFIIKAIASKDIAAAVSAFTAVTLVTAPIPVTVALKWLLDSFNRRLNPIGSAVPSYSAAVSFASDDAVIFDAAEIYDGESLNVPGAKTFGGFELYDAILYAAAMFISSDSPLGSIFKKIIVDRTELLPKTEALIYEDKQGLSAWIDNKKVLAGTRDMMINHNIEVPDPALEKKYLRNLPNNKIVYLSIDGSLAALFVVSYVIKPELANEIMYLAKHGYTILLRSTDPNINEAFAEQQLRLSADTIKVLNGESAEYYKLCRKELPKTVAAGVFSTKSMLSALKAMTHSVMLKNALDITTPLAVTGAVLGLLLTALILIFSSSAVPGYALFLLQMLIAVIGTFACRILAKK